MHRLWLSTLVLLLLWVCAVPGHLIAQGRVPIPPGIRAADKAQDKADQTLEPPQQSAQQKLNSTELLRQSDELLALAQQVQIDTKQAMQGLLAKDLKDKLKRIEKLSKQLREELTP
jgi:hypothetical protein